jgi:heterodisulfide reductase subunit A
MTDKVIGAVMVVGGGIGGIQAALDLAGSGYRVYLVEKKPSIGGVMAQLDKTFPTNDCSMCIMSPKLVEVGRHRNIQLLTRTEIRRVEGGPGDFRVSLTQKARYVDMEKCVACGVCAEKCPKKVTDLFNGGLAKRKAIYIQYPQAVPLKYVIDREACLFFEKGRCRACEKFCPSGAIRFDDQDRDLNLAVGSIILAPGFKAFDPSDLSFYGYKDNPDVVTSLEFERLLSASGPTMGHLIRPSDHQDPRKIAWLQCVGSRSTQPGSHAYCSSVCCMYAIKQALVAKEHAGPGKLDATIFFMDMRTHGKGFEACYNDARNRHGVKFERCRIHSVTPDRAAGGQRISWVDENGGSREEVFDLVVLSVGLETDPQTKALAENLGLALTDGDFASTCSFDPTQSSRPGVFVAGAFAGPKDIPQTVIEAGSAALGAGALLASARDTLTTPVTPPPQTSVAGDPPRVGVFICYCGINIGSVVNVPAVREYAAGLPFVEYAADNLYSCSQDTQDAITRIIREKNLNRIVVAACSPRTHEPLFQETLLNAGLNKYLFEMVNIRNQNSWVHKDWPEEATGKAKDLVRMAVSRVALQTPLAEETLSVEPAALVVGGGVAGMTAARALSRHGYPVHLVERSARLGGQALNLWATAKGESIPEGLARLVRDVETEPLITRHLETRLEAVDGYVGQFRTTIRTGGTSRTLTHGVAVIATGARESVPQEYLFGQDLRVVTGLELDRRMIAGDPELDRLGAVVFIQCVGSREIQRPYCSRLCCSHSLASALHLKKKNPDARIYILYRDIRSYGEREDLYKRARELGVIFIRYDLERKPVATADEAGLRIRARDHILGRDVTIRSDLLVLAAAVEPYRDAALAQLFKVPMNEDGFFAEAHVKLGPSEFASDGVFLCGLAHYPKPLDESVAQAQAAASRAVALLSRKTIQTSGTVAWVMTARCTGCGVCVDVCPYSAPSLISAGPNAGRAEVNPVLCKGCGSCVSSCRSNAAQLRGFEQSQIFSMIAAFA